MLLGGGRSTSSNNGDRRSRLQVCIIGHEPLDVLTRDLSDQKGQIYGSAPYSSGHVSYGSCGWIPRVTYIYFASFLEKRDEQQCLYKDKRLLRGW